MKNAINIADLRELARRRVPRAVFELLDSASEDGRVLALGLARLQQYSLVPRVLRGPDQRDQSATLFGRKWSASFGIAPTGTVGILRRDIELHLARAAARADIPMIISGASALCHEDVIAAAPGNVWSQLYTANDQKITEDLIHRAADAGAGALVWTVSNSITPKNDRLIRSGYGIPPTLSLADKLEALLHPAWMVEYLGGNMAGMAQWQKYSDRHVAENKSASADPMAVHRFYMSQRNAKQTWKDVDMMRRLWKGPLVIKGLLHAEDALRAAECGADGVIVSNHGGFGLDRAPASIDMLPGVVAAAGDKITVMFDSGVRRGSDIVLARCMGAKFVFVGRATLFGATAHGEEGALQAINILKDEFDRSMGQIGCASQDELGPQFIRGPDAAH